MLQKCYTCENKKGDSFVMSKKHEKSIAIEDLDFSVRTYNCLKRAGINTLDELMEMSEDDLIRVRNLGRNGVEEAMRKIGEMKERGKVLGTDAVSRVYGALCSEPEDIRYCPDMLIEELDLSVSAYNCLKRAGIDTLRDLVAMGEMDFVRVRNLGRKSMEEVLQKIEKMKVPANTSVGLTRLYQLLKKEHDLREEEAEAQAIKTDIQNKEREMTREEIARVDAGLTYEQKLKVKLANIKLTKAIFNLTKESKLKCEL